MKQEPSPTIKYFAYTRKSTEGEEKQALSIESQIDKIQEYFPDLMIVELLEERKSAFVPYNRSVFANMMERIKAGEAQGIIAWHPDRLSRNEIDAATITYMIRTGHIIDLKFGSYNFDNSPEGIWMLQMALSQSQYSSAKLSKDVKRGMEKKVKIGWFPGVAPEGYLNDKYAQKGEKKIAIDPVRFPLVRKMFEMLLSGNYTAPKVVEVVNTEWGYQTLKRKKQGGGPLIRSTFYTMITNPFYAGLIRYKGQLYPGNHQPMISLEEFDHIQRILGRAGKPRPSKHEFAFTGIIRCGECGCRITAEYKTKFIKRDNAYKTYTFYHCTKRKPEARCTQKIITKDALEEQIKELLNQYTILPEFRDWALEVLNDQNDTEVDEQAKVFDMQHQTLAQTEKELASLTKMRYRELISDEEFTIERNTLKTKLSNLKEQLKNVEARSEKWFETTEKAFHFTTNALQAFNTDDMQIKREILNSLGEKFILKDHVLAFEPSSWLVPIGKQYKTLETQFKALEPTKTAHFEHKKAALAALRLTWLPTKDELRIVLRALSLYRVAFSESL